MTIVRGIDSGRRNGGLMRPPGSLTPLTEARREVGNGRVQPASTPCAGLPMSAGCAMCVNGGETIVGGTGDGDPEFPGSRQAKTSEASSSTKHSGKRHEVFDCDPRSVGRCPGMRSRPMDKRRPDPRLGESFVLRSGRRASSDLRPSPPVRRLLPRRRVPSSDPHRPGAPEPGR
jgi:hypothetical protein